MMLCPSGLPIAHRVETVCLSFSQVELPCSPSPHPHPPPLSGEPLSLLTGICHPSPEVFPDSLSAWAPWASETHEKSQVSFCKSVT